MRGLFHRLRLRHEGWQLTKNRAASKSIAHGESMRVDVRVEHLRPEPVRPVEEGGADALDSPAARALGSAVGEACAAPEAERPQKAREVNELILAMRPGEHSAVYAQALLQLLHRGAFAGLSDDLSRPCVAVAVSTVRTLGPPWSNQLSEKDFAELRGTPALLSKASGMPTSNTVVLITFGAILSGLIGRALFPKYIYVTGMGKHTTVSPGLFAWIVVASFIGLVGSNWWRKRRR
jgi:hypothetical protein